MNDPEAKTTSQTTVDLISRRADGSIKEHIRVNPDGTETRIV